MDRNTISTYPAHRTQKRGGQRLGVERITEARAAARAKLHDDVLSALNGQLGDMDVMCETLTQRYDQHVTQAVLKLIQHASTVQDLAEQEARRELREQFGVR